ncbi:hypothetical protein ABPG72_008618 [Tetrahymena utriculariae]
MATPKSTSLNYAKLRNQKRNNSNVDIDKELGHLYSNQETQQPSSQSGIQQIDNTNFIQEKKTNQINQNQSSQTSHTQQEHQQNQVDSNKGLHNLASTGQGNQNQQQTVYPMKQQQQQPYSLNQKNMQDFQYKQNSSQQYDSQNQNNQQIKDFNTIQNDSKEDNQISFKAQNQQQQSQQQQIQNQEKRSQPNDAAYQSNQDYIYQMIKQKKHVEDPTKVKQKNVIGKTPIPPFMKNFHQMQQMQQQQELFMKQQKSKQQLKNQQSYQHQQQNSDDTVRLNQNSSVNSQAKNNTENQQLDNSLQIENSSQQVNEQSTNQDEKLTQRKTLGNSQPKLFDQFFRNNSYQGTMSQNSQPSPQISVAQTQRNTNTHQEKIQNISVLSNQSDLKNSNNTSQVLTQPAQSQQIFHSNHFNTSPSHSYEQQLNNNNPNSNIHQNHHLSSINRDNPITIKRQSHTQIHQHQSQQSQIQNHQKKESSLFNSQSSTILNNSLGNISPTAQFNNLDSSQFNISNISNIQNLSHNISSINNQSNIMINYNSNNVMNNSNMNSTMSFQKQFEEQIPNNENNQGKEEIQNSDFLNSLNIYIDYFNNGLQEGEKQVKTSQQSNTNLELFKENQRLKSQLEQLEEKLKETETSRKILINDLSKIKNKDSQYKKKIQQLIKENNETKTLLLSTNYKLHHTQEQYAKEKIEHENTKFTLKKALLARSNNMENNNLLNKAENIIAQQKNQAQKKSFLQQYNIQENRSLQNNQKFGINNQASSQFQKPYQNSFKILNEPHSNYLNGKQYQTSVPQLYSNSNDPPSLSSLVVNQQQVYDGEQTAISRIVDQDLKMIDPIYVNQNQPQNFSNQISLQQNIQEIPLIADRFNGPAFGGGLQNIHQNEFDELECKDFNLDDSNQNLDVSGPDVYQDNQRDDLTDNTTDIINLNQPSPSIHIQSNITPHTGGGRVNSLHQQKYQSNYIPLFETNQQLTSNNQLGYKQQAKNGMQEDEYEQDGEDMDLSDNFNLDTDNQINEDNSALNIQNQNKGQLEALTLPIQSDLDLIQDGQHQYYDYQSNKIFNTYDNSNFKYSTHRDHMDQNTKGVSQLAATSYSYKKGVGSLDEDHVYQMMKLQYHPTSSEMNKQNQNMKMAHNTINQSNQQNFKSQLKKQQIYQNRNQQGGRTMSLSYQKPQFSSQQIQMFQMMQSQKQKINMQQQQQQLYQQQQQLQPYANYL